MMTADEEAILRLITERAAEAPGYCCSDPVNSPAHYTVGKVEVIEIIKDQLSPEEFLGFCKGNALKYLCRAGKKDPKKTREDLQKAAWYLNRCLREEKES